MAPAVLDKAADQKDEQIWKNIEVTFFNLHFSSNLLFLKSN